MFNISKDLQEELAKVTGWVLPNHDHSGYLLDKLPSSIQSREHPGSRAYLTTRKDERNPDDHSSGYVYFAWYIVIGADPSDFGAYADTPADALAKLCLELHRQGLLKAEADKADS